MWTFHLLSRSEISDTAGSDVPDMAVRKTAIARRITQAFAKPVPTNARMVIL